MALTKITPQMFDTSATAHDLNVDNGTFVVDGSASRVGIGTPTPSTLLDVNGTATATTFVGALTGNVTGTILTAAQTNITSLGTLTGLTTSGNVLIDSATVSANPGLRVRRNHGGQAFQQLSGLSFYWNTSNGSQDNSIVYGASANSYLSLVHATGSAFNERVRIDSSGNVGIGTASPSNKLDVIGNALIQGTAGFNAASETANLYLGDTNSVIRAVYGVGTHIMTNNVERLTVRGSTGNVGIGTTSPGRKLDVKGAVQFSVNTASHETFLFTTQAANDAKLMMQNSSAATAAQVSANGHTFFNGGNVGIGESTPDASLHITSNTPTIAFDESDASQDYRIGSYGGTFALYDETDSAYRFAVDGTGKFGIGTSSPGSILEVVNSGEARIKARSTNNNWAGLDLESHSAQSGYIFFRDNSAERARIQVTDGNDILFQNTSSHVERMRIDGNGKVIIGGTTPQGGGLLTLEGPDSNMLVLQRTADTGDQSILFYDHGDYNATITGKNGGGLELRTNGNSKIAIAMDSSGYVTTPNQPSFRAGATANYSHTSGNPIQFNSVSSTMHHNTSGSYSTSTYRFTAPVAGLYYFHAVVIWMSMDDGDSMIDSLRFKVNSTMVGYSAKRSVYKTDITGTDGYFVDHVTDILALSANDYVQVIGQKTETVHGNHQYTRFIGYLVG